MKTNSTYSIIILIVVACLTSLGIQAAQRSLPVTIENADENPVPVKGAITVDNDAGNPVPVTVENHQTSITVDNDSSNPVPVVMPGSVSVKGNNYRFVGLSSPTLPSIGASSMDLLCQDRYGNESRMCDSKEYIGTPTVLSAPQGTGWLWPTIVSSYYNAAEQKPAHVIYPDYVTVGDPGKFTCNTWATTPPTDWTGTAGSRSEVGSAIRKYILRVPCQNSMPVACCAPH